MATTDIDEGWVTDPDALKTIFRLRGLQRGDLVKIGKGQPPMQVHDPNNYYWYFDIQAGPVYGWKRPQ